MKLVIYHYSDVTVYYRWSLLCYVPPYRRIVIAVKQW